MVYPNPHSLKKSGTEKIYYNYCKTIDVFCQVLRPVIIIFILKGDIK
jgi:hypothetical protein